LVQAVRFHGVKLCQLLEARSEEAWCEDPVAGVEWARLAVEISGRLNEERYGPGLVADTQATAWACFGNSYRVASDLRRAEEALDEAEVRIRRSGGEGMRRRRSSASVLLCVAHRVVFARPPSSSTALSPSTAKPRTVTLKARH